MTAAKKSRRPPPNVLADPKGGVYTQYVALAHLQRWPKNPKKHDVPGIKASILRFGYVAPIVLDEGTGRIVAGHGRLDSIAEIKVEVEKKVEGVARPKNILERGGEWYVPLLRGNTFESEREAEAYVIADNRHVETGGWDAALHAEMLGKFRDDPNLIALGYTERELKAVVDPTPVKAPDQKSVSFMAKVGSQFQIVITCKDEREQLRWLEKLGSEGLDVRAILG